jgi:sterol desaturase/sphingolipid hydroxylase (fatty acid hydroxylase superfamily)
MTISQKILSSQDVDTYDVDKRSNPKVGAPVLCRAPAETFFTHKPICPAPVTTTLPWYNRDTHTVWKKGPPKINFLKDGLPFWIWSALVILVLTVTLALAPGALFTTEYNVQFSKYSSVMKCTIFGLFKCHLVSQILFMIVFAIAGYFLEIRTVAGRVRTPQELSYMAKEYAFSCLGWFYLNLWHMLWRLFVESNYTSEPVPITWWGVSVIILQFCGSFLWLDNAYFWMHYTLHIKYPINIYKLSHHFHHLFREPSAMAAECLEPFEQLLIIVLVRCIKFVFPIEVWILDLVLAISALSSFFGHLSEAELFFTPGWDQVGLGFLADRGLLVSNAKHRLHHLYVRSNYSIFALTYWDHILGTNKTSTRKWEQLKRVCLRTKKSTSKEI